MNKLEQELSKPINLAISRASNNVNSMKTVAVFGRETHVAEMFNKKQQPDIKEHRQAVSWNSLIFGLSQTVVLFVCGLLFWYGGYQLADGSVAVAELFSTFEAAMTRREPLGAALNTPHSSSMVERQLPEMMKLALKGTEIEFMNVNLEYSNRKEQLAIENLNLRIPAGQRVAFCTLLSRFYEPCRGAILIDGEDVRSVTPDEHLDKIALVSQDAVLREGTIRFNLVLGLSRKVSDQEIIDVCRDAQVMEFVTTPELGLDPPNDTKGSNLSGGQKQRLCIARALLRDAQILQLDESTSALDNKSEALCSTSFRSRIHQPDYNYDYVNVSLVFE
ncbi:Multidrug/pheromone exporter, ABC superfamily [Phaffia rhodozyma]|uniref:Multidrug/pheromone exporter, ABC superfamily n=1 Tax=Phaffia rhodozyma TaxID=264483 RepID=A0A0F7SMK2_PHARH|nr:Multidrug/pheromone exporter, ABC superfamily [Phaffia rhodozyma]